MSSEQNETTQAFEPKKFPDHLAGLSDLFFNYEHPSYDSLLRDTADPYDSQIAEALVADAKDFRETFCIALAPLPYVLFSIDYLRYDDYGVPTAEAFAADFLARL